MQGGMGRPIGRTNFRGNNNNFRGGGRGNSGDNSFGARRGGYMKPSYQNQGNNFNGGQNNMGNMIFQGNSRGRGGYSRGRGRDFNNRTPYNGNNGQSQGMNPIDI
jgi:hypothetical protein